MALVLCVGATAAVGLHAAPARAQAVPEDRLFVANSGNDSVSTVEPAHPGNPVYSTPVGHHPEFIALNSAGTRGYVTNTDEGTVTVLNTSDNPPTHVHTITIGAGTRPTGVAWAMTVHGPRVYVANSDSHTVSVIDATSNTRLADVHVPPSYRDFNHPEAVAATPDGRYVYVTNFYEDFVSVIDTATNNVDAEITVGGNPRGVAVSPNGRMAYVTNWSTHSVSVIDTSTHQNVQTIDLPTEDINPFGVAFAPDGTTAYVTQYTEDRLSVITGIDPFNPAALPTGHHDAPVGRHPVGVVVSCTGIVYVANSGEDTVSVFDRNGNPYPSVYNVIYGFHGPWGLAIPRCGTHVITQLRSWEHPGGEAPAGQPGHPLAIGLGEHVTDTVELPGLQPPTSGASGVVHFAYYTDPVDCRNDTEEFLANLTAPARGESAGTEPVVDDRAESPPSGPFHTAGTFYWVAFYTGDDTHAPAVSGCEDEPLWVRPDVTTNLTHDTAPTKEARVGDVVTDTATLKGLELPMVPNVNVKVQFYRYEQTPDGVNACHLDTNEFLAFPPDGHPIHGIPVEGEQEVREENGAATATLKTELKDAGNFYWVAFFEGDTRYPRSVSGCDDEPLTVRPLITTELSADQVRVGASVEDAAVVHTGAGPEPAGGRVVFRVYDETDMANDICLQDVDGFESGALTAGDLRGEPAGEATVGLAGSTGEVSHPFTGAGVFHWVAFFEGDADHAPSASGCYEEPVTVEELLPVTVTTELSRNHVRVDGTVSDTAQVLTGTSPVPEGDRVVFRVYDEADVTGNACQLDVDEFESGDRTADELGGIYAGEATVGADGRTEPEVSHQFTGEGVFHWVAFYEGDADHAPSASRCDDEDEAVTVEALLPVTVTTQLSEDHVRVGSTVGDTAQVLTDTGPVTEGGRVVFRVYDEADVLNNACQEDVDAFESGVPGHVMRGEDAGESVVGPGGFTEAVSHQFTGEGVFQWVAFYEGDADHAASASRCDDENEAVTVEALLPVTVTTQLSEDHVRVGGTVSDSAQVLTGTSPVPEGGRVVFRAYDEFDMANNYCQEDVDAFESGALGHVMRGEFAGESVVGPGGFTGEVSHPFPATGEFQWVAFYEGDADHAASASRCDDEDEAVTVEALLPVTVTTQLSGDHVRVGGSVSDSAQVLTDTGPVAEDGLVEFRVYDETDMANNYCQEDVDAFESGALGHVMRGIPMGTEPVGPGGFTGVVSHPFGTAGTFYWVAFYEGDTDHAPSASRCDGEPVTVSALEPATVTTHMVPAGGQVRVGGSVSDSAQVTGSPTAVPEGGLVEFRVYTDQDVLDNACQEDVDAFESGALGHLMRGLPVGTEPVRADGITDEVSHQFPVEGTFHWVAFYEGDADHAPSASGCEDEAVTVAEREPATVTTHMSPADGQVRVDGTVSDSAQVTGAPTPVPAGGLVEFRVYTDQDVLDNACQEDVDAFESGALGHVMRGIPVGTEPVGAGGFTGEVSHQFSTAGTFYWVAFHEGDTDHAPSASRCDDELVTVTAGPPPQPGISVTKSAAPPSFNRAGQVITYTYRVTNTGNVQINGVGVTDTKVSGVQCQQTTLDPGKSTTCTGRYTTADADVRLGHIANRASAHGTPLGGVLEESPPTVLDIPEEHPSVTVVKTASVRGFVRAGETITYSYHVHNTGNAPLHDVTVTDNRIGAVPCSHGPLKPGASMTCTARYTVTYADVRRGYLSNTATVSGKTPSGAEVRQRSTRTLPFTGIRPVRPRPALVPPITSVPVRVTG